jgi:uncharacterized protein (TIGR03435 family)
MTALTSRVCIFVREPLVALAVSISLTAPHAHCQSSLSQVQAAPQAAHTSLADPVFEVAAIHQNVADQSGRSHIVSSTADGHFLTINASLQSIVRWAFDMPETRILGGPAWMSSTKFDIDAKGDASVDAQLHGLSSDDSRAVKRRMVQGLLADRFKLVTHRETRELPIYALVVAKGGAKLGATQANGTTINARRGQIEVQGSNSVALLAEELSKIVGRVVVDKTGIEGRYNIVLKWTPDDSAGSGFNAPPAFNATASAAPAADSGPSIFTAIQEQLGLKLDAEKGPVEVLVIDHIEMPSEN